jgi:hypothetical protein
MKLGILCCTVTSLAALVGCDYDSYEVEMKPEGEVLQRQVTCWHMGGEHSEEVQKMDDQKLARIGALYEKRESPVDAKKQVFSGRFTGRTPADIGGAGSYEFFASPLGNTSYYAERFRGVDDLESQLAKRRQAADELIGLLEGWMAAELLPPASRMNEASGDQSNVGGRKSVSREKSSSIRALAIPESKSSEPDFPKLKQFLKNNLRQDLINLGIYEWAGTITEDRQEKTEEEFFFRGGLYLWERGYFTPQEIPALYRSLNTKDYQAILRHVQRLLARKLGVADDQPIPESLAFMNDPTHLKASFDKYVRTTELFRRRVDEWKEKKAKDDKDLREPAPEDIAEELLLKVFGESAENWGEGNDSVKVRLLCGQKPYSTNGIWEESISGVTWNSSLKPNRSLPAMFYAAWSTPDQKFQESHFGKILLQGEDLAEFVAWHRSLNPEETKEWNQFLNNLKPGSGLKTSIESFRFANDPKVNSEKPDQGSPSLADIPRQLLLKRLDAKDNKN